MHDMVLSMVYPYYVTYLLLLLVIYYRKCINIYDCDAQFEGLKVSDSHTSFVNSYGISLSIHKLYIMN